MLRWRNVSIRTRDVWCVSACVRRCLQRYIRISSSVYTGSIGHRQTLPSSVLNFFTVGFFASNALHRCNHISHFLTVGLLDHIQVLVVASQRQRINAH